MNGKPLNSTFFHAPLHMLDSEELIEYDFIKLSKTDIQM